MAGFPLDFPVVFTVSITMIRLIYIIESYQSFQIVLFSDLSLAALVIPWAFREENMPPI